MDVAIDIAKKEALGQSQMESDVSNDELTKQIQFDVTDEKDADEWKVWLFKENIRLISLEKSLQEQREQFEKEREQFQEEMKQWSQQIRYEKNRLEQESKFFDKKFKILEHGFKQLAADKEEFAAKKRAYEARKTYYAQPKAEQQESGPLSPASSFYFRGVRNPATLKKRYKDLMKVFHPDNMGGDRECVDTINAEYERVKLFIGV